MSNMYPWAEKRWNPIHGACPHACFYCYVPHMTVYRTTDYYKGKPRLYEPAFKPLGKGKTIFVCSMIDLMAKEIPEIDIVKVLEHCRKYDNTYLLQSKNPKRFLDFIQMCPDKTIFGTTIETNRQPEFDISRIYALQLLIVHSYKTFLSLEPIMDFDLEPLVKQIKTIKPSFVSIGADSKNHYLPEPSWDKVQTLIKELKKFTEVRVKDNLNRLKKG